MHLYIILISFLTSHFVLHDFHVSKSDIHYKSEKRAVQITINVFIDDLELALSEYSIEKMSLFSDSEYEKSDSLIDVYLQDHFKIAVDDLPARPYYLGKEISDDLSAAWMYMELENVVEVSKIQLTNTILFKEFEDQKNIVNVKMNNKSKAFFILDHKDFTKTVNFD